MLERFPLVSRAMQEGRFSALGSPDDWEITPDDAWEVRDYCSYVLDWYRVNLSGSPADMHFFEQTRSKVDSMLSGGGWLWDRPTALEHDIAAGNQLTFDID